MGRVGSKGADRSTCENPQARPKAARSRFAAVEREGAFGGVTDTWTLKALALSTSGTRVAPQRTQ